MSYKGHVHDGVVVLDEPADLPEGTHVTINVVAPHHYGAERMKRYQRFIGAVAGKPSDWSEHHDQYLQEEYRQEGQGE